MELNLDNFNIRNSKPIILGNAGLPKNTERYHLNGMGIIGIDIYKDDKIKIINIFLDKNLHIVKFIFNLDNVNKSY